MLYLNGYLPEEPSGRFTSFSELRFTGAYQRAAVTQLFPLVKICDVSEFADRSLFTFHSLLQNLKKKSFENRRKFFPLVSAGYLSSLFLLFPFTARTRKYLRRWGREISMPLQIHHGELRFSDSER